MYQRNLTVPPRLAREGWIPATPEKRPNRRNMLIPKTGRPSDYLPTIMDFSDAPRENRVLKEICETGDLIQQNGHTYLVARVSSVTLDSLATFETSREDLELETDQEQVNEDADDSDDEPDHDNEPDYRQPQPIYSRGARS